jgi:2-polyprenyl-3-methyl-5-hydroxy-6-metoxy-1,4-benzoquinol methylase
MNFHPKENSFATSEVCVPILKLMYNPQSVLDLGCNVGAWLLSFERVGVKDVIGIDGDNMKESLVMLNHDFIAHDLTRALDLNRKFDLVLCLEVAEHIDEKHADTLIDNAIRHSDLIFWSAATKGQGGYKHVNEQPHEYWINKFAAKGYKHRMMNELLPDLPHNYYKTNAIEFKR